MPYGITKMKRYIRGWVKPVFWFLVVIFLIGGAYSFRNPGTGGRAGRAGGGVQRRQSPVVARVNGHDISRASYEMAWRRYVEHKDITAWSQAKLGFYERLLHDMLLQQAAKRERIRVSGREIEAKRRELVDQELTGAIEERASLQQQLQKKGITLDQLKQQMLESYREDDVRSMLEQQKLEEKIESAVSVTDDDLKRSFEEMRLAHILCSPREMKRKAEAAVDAELAKLPKPPAPAKADAKGVAAAPDPKRVELEARRAALEQQDWDAEAKKKADGLMAQLKGGADFAALAKQESDDQHAAAGDYLIQNPVGNGPWLSLQNIYMLAQFGGGPELWIGFRDIVEAALPLKAGEVAGPVKTAGGWNIIRKEGSRPALPKDFEKSKPQAMSLFVQQQKDAAWLRYQQQLRETAKIDVFDPEVKAYEEERRVGPEAPQLVTLLDQAIGEDPLNVGAMWELATIWKEKGQPAEAIRLLRQALDAMKKAPDFTNASTTSGRVNLELGLLLKAQGQKDEALACLRNAADGILAGQGGYDQEMEHQQLLSAFKELGRADLASAEQKWLNDFRKQQKAGPGGGGSIVMPPS